MSYRRTLIFLAVFLSLAGFYYFYEVRGGHARKEAEERAKRLVSLEPEDVSSVTINRPGETVAVQKENGKWGIIRPLKAAAEQARVDQLVKTATGLQYERDLGDQVNLQPFGLAEPEISLVVAGSGKGGNVLIGSSTPDGKNFYVKKEAGSRVFTAPISAKKQLDVDLFALRDKTLVDFSSPDVTAITLYRDGRSVSLKKKEDNNWKIVSPKELDADSDAISDLLNSVKYARVKKFVEENASDLQPYGLGKPSARVELWFNEKQAAISFGKKAEDKANLTYASVDGTQRVIELDASLVQKITAAPDDWRNKQLVKLAPEKITRVEIETPETHMRLEQSGAEPKQWMMVEPEQKQADNSHIDALLRSLSKAKAVRFVGVKELAESKRRLETPKIRVLLWKTPEEQPEKLAFAKADAEGEWLVLTSSGDTAVVKDGLVKQLPLKPDELADKSVVHFKAADVEQIGLKTADKEYSLKRKDVNWSVPRGLHMESYEVDQLLWNLHEWKYASLEPKDKEDSFYGFVSPTLSITLRDGGEKTRTLVIGKKIPGGDSFYIEADGAKSVMVVEGKFLDDLLEKLSG